MSNELKKLMPLIIAALPVAGAVAGALLGWWLDRRVRTPSILGAVAMLLSFCLCSAVWIRSRGQTDRTGFPPSVLFMPICALTCAAFGLAMAYLSHAYFVSSFFLMLLLGFGYGWLLYRVAALLAVKHEVLEEHKGGN